MKPQCLKPKIIGEAFSITSITVATKTNQIVEKCYSSNK